MANTETKIQKVTSKGQITLPAVWRKKHQSNYIVLKQKEEMIYIEPIVPEEKDEYTVFDAIRDNKGKGLKASDLISILKKIDRK